MAKDINTPNSRITTANNNKSIRKTKSENLLPYQTSQPSSSLELQNAQTQELTDKQPENLEDLRIASATQVNIIQVKLEKLKQDILIKTQASLKLDQDIEKKDKILIEKNKLIQQQCNTAPLLYRDISDNREESQIDNTTIIKKPNNLFSKTIRVIAIALPIFIIDDKFHHNLLLISLTKLIVNTIKKAPSACFHFITPPVIEIGRILSRSVSSSK